MLLTFLLKTAQIVCPEDTNQHIIESKSTPAVLFLIDIILSLVVLTFSVLFMIRTVPCLAEQFSSFAYIGHTLPIAMFTYSLFSVLFSISLTNSIVEEVRAFQLQQKLMQSDSDSLITAHLKIRK